ncbi:ATP-binding protein [Actinoplanes sp. NPDC049802]|uniref:ATP-binding protein n=1 Tax=Actinoplanes sp. NPDC049802 TaxID=3154742 RepID=UPI0033FAD909
MRRKRSLISALVALVCCAVTLGVSVELERRESQAGAVQMDRRTAAAAEAVRAETRRYVDMLRATAASAGAQQVLTRTEYSAMTAPLGSMQLAGASSIAFIVPSDDTGVHSVQRLWRERAAPDLTLAPYGRGDHAFSIYVRSLGDRTAPAGLDMMGAQAPAAALAESRRTGGVAVSDTYQLLADRDLPADQRQLSFVLTAPVHQQEPRRFLGWIMLGVRGQDFMGATLANAGQGLLDLELVAADEQRRGVVVAALRSGQPGERDLHRTVAVPVAGGTWVLRLSAVRDRLPGAHSVLPFAVAGGGLSLTVLLTALVWVLATARERAEARVRTAIAELRAREGESHRQAGLLSAVLNGISDGVGVVGPDGRFLMYNPAAERILGTRRGRSELFLADGVTPYPDGRLPLNRALNGEDTDEEEMVVRGPEHPEGRIISVSARPIETSGGERGAVAVFHDITDRKHVENELRGFAGVVAHDLKAPLTSVRGYAELITEALGDPAPGANTLELVRRGAAKVIDGAIRMQTLITELLDYTAARDATLRVDRVDLRALVDDVVAARADAPEGPGSRPDVFVAALPDVRADRVLLRQVVDNLVGNAIKYTPPGQAPRIDVTARDAGNGMVRVQVADRGIGIPDGEHAAVFDSFHRASNGTAMPGTGLGLAICRRIVERHGGQIEAMPNPGGGTVFTFTIAGIRSGDRLPANVP